MSDKVDISVLRKGKTKYWVALGIVILVCVVSYQNKSQSYPFQQPLSQVKEIGFFLKEGSDISEDAFTVLRVITGDEAERFLKEFSEMKCYRPFKGPDWGYGTYVIKIVYDNGDREIIGPWNNEYVPAGEEPSGFGSYHFDEDEFRELFEKYVGDAQ